MREWPSDYPFYEISAEEFSFEKFSCSSELLFYFISTYLKVSTPNIPKYL